MPKPDDMAGLDRDVILSLTKSMLRQILHGGKIKEVALRTEMLKVARHDSKIKSVNIDLTSNSFDLSGRGNNHCFTYATYNSVMLQ